MAELGYSKLLILLNVNGLNIPIEKDDRGSEIWLEEKEYIYDMSNVLSPMPEYTQVWSSLVVPELQ